MEPVFVRAIGRHALVLRALVVFAVALGAEASRPSGSSAQEPTPSTSAPAPAQTSSAATAQALSPLQVSPRGALIRAMLLPGWGHVAIGSHTRGGFYFALEAATAYTFVRTRIRLNEARERAALRESVVRARLQAERTHASIPAPLWRAPTPDEIDAALEADEDLQSLEDLVSSREGQQEDLIAWSIFLVFLSGADAYVSAHLSRFPAPIEMDAAATPDGRAEVMLRIPFP